MTGSLVVPMIWDLHINLTEVLNILREPAPVEDEVDVRQTRAILLPLVQAVHKNLNLHRDDGSVIMQRGSARLFTKLSSRRTHGNCTGSVVQNAPRHNSTTAYDEDRSKHCLVPGPPSAAAT